MSHVGPTIEGELTVQLLSLTLDNEQNKSCDSFSSEPETLYNKGAVDFMLLVEAVLAKQENVRFENLIVDMMDLDIGVG